MTKALKPLSLRQAGPGPKSAELPLSKILRMQRFLENESAKQKGHK